jgi:hypothetical protein
MRKRPSDRGHEQPVPAAKTRAAHLSLEYPQLVAKDHHLDLGCHQLVGRAGDQPENTVQQQIREREEHDRTSQEKEGRSYERSG